ncbi:MAG: hypothetical protein JWL62_2556, partial [Hyphomicrobiales bacterium]|nr:hypothetical protein [Hyphomicrobiales bacterium]
MLPQRQFNKERGADAKSTLDTNVAAHPRRKFAADRKTETGAAEATRNRAVDLREVTEEILQVFLSDPYPCVLGPHHQAQTTVVLAFARDSEKDVAVRRELDRVAQQIEH